MAKISSEYRKLYSDRTKPYKDIINSLVQYENRIIKEIDSRVTDRALKYLDLAEDMIYLASNCIALNSVSESMLIARNSAALEEGRKALYKAVIYLEKIVSPLIDAPFSEYEELLEEIYSVSALRRYSIVKKLGLAIRLLEKGFGDNSKWKWSFVELEGRYAAVTKNIINLKTAVVNTDPRSADYEPIMRHLRLIKRLLQQSADRYRKKFESSTKNPEDLRMGIQFLDSLKRLHIVLGERRSVEIIKRMSETWRMRLDGSMETSNEETLSAVEYGT